jgi:hypothetical protein
MFINYVRVDLRSRSLAGVAGSNPGGGVDVCMLWVLCDVKNRSLRWADHHVCLCVCVTESDQTQQYLSTATMSRERSG